MKCDTDQLSRVVESEFPESQALAKSRSWSCFIFGGISVGIGNQSLFFSVANLKTESFFFLEALLSFYGFGFGVSEMESFRVELETGAEVVCQTS